MKLTPLHDWAVIVPSEAGDRTAGGLYIPDTAREKPEEGIVEAIGPGAYEEEKHDRKKGEKKERKFIPATVKPGDRILFERWAGRSYTIGNEERILVRERDVLGLLDRPLLIPAVTSPSSATTSIERSAPVPAPKPQVKTPAVRKQAAAKPSAKKTAKKKAAKKATKGTAKKTAKKKAAKPAKASKARSSKGKKTGKKK